MGLGLEGMKSLFGSKKNEMRGVTLSQLLVNNDGFPLNYLPQVRHLDGQDYIKTTANGNDVNNMPVFYKWIFINTIDLSATPDSNLEYARIPESGYIMRIMQRSLLPYHENFVIDYFENINSINVITLDQETRAQYGYQQDKAYRTFRIGDSAVPKQLKDEIFSYPDVFFKAYIEEAIPPSLLYNESGSSSNHISAYGGSYTNNNNGYNNHIDMNIMSHGLKSPTSKSVNNSQYSPSGNRPKAPNNGRVYYPRGTNMNANTIQNKINQQVASQHNMYGGPARGEHIQPQKSTNQSKPLSISETGFRYQI